MYDKDTSDFYIRYPDHPNYDPDVVQITDPVDVLVGKIENVLFSNKGDVLGDPLFGADLENLIWKTRVNDVVIRERVQEQFGRYIPELSRVPYTIEVVFMQDGQKHQDMGLIIVTLPDREVAALIA